MTARSETIGRAVHFDIDSKRWVYSDNLHPAGYRTCNHCGKFVSSISLDPCLGKLPGVKYACCGHGDSEKSYIMFENGIIVRNFIICDC